MVEFAVVLPVLLLLVTGIGSFGLVLNNYLQLTDAVSLGAQELSISRGNTTDPCADTAGWIHNAAPYLYANKINLTYVLNGVSYGPFTGTSSASCSSGSYSTGAAGNLQPGKSIQVIASYPCTLAVYGYNFDCNLHAQITEIVQ